MHVVQWRAHFGFASSQEHHLHQQDLWWQDMMVFDYAVFLNKYIIPQNSILEFDFAHLSNDTEVTQTQVWFIIPTNQ